MSVVSLIKDKSYIFAFTALAAVNKRFAFSGADRDADERDESEGKYT